MARSTKTKWLFQIVKNPQKQGAWLMSWVKELPTDGAVSLEELDDSMGASAWTTQMACKRAAAAKVGRTRLTWEQLGDSETDLIAEFIG